MAKMSVLWLAGARADVPKSVGFGFVREVIDCGKVLKPPLRGGAAGRDPGWAMGKGVSGRGPGSYPENPRKGLGVVRPSHLNFNF